MVVPPAPNRVPSQRPLAPSVASVTSVSNDKSDNEMIPGAVHRSSGICLTAEENPTKLTFNFIKILKFSIKTYVDGSGLFEEIGEMFHIIKNQKILTEGRRLYIGSFCPAMTSLSRYKVSRIV